MEHPDTRNQYTAEPQSSRSRLDDSPYLGGAANTTVGWAQIQASSTVSAYAIFTQRVPARPDQDGTAPAAAATNRVLIPIDNTGEYVTSVALANPAASIATITAAFQPSSGSPVQLDPISLPANGHAAFSVPQKYPATAAQSGLLELTSSSGSISALALRFNATGGFTTAPVYPVSGSSIIGGGGSGGGGNIYSAFNFSVATFQPVGSASGNMLLQSTLNADQQTYSVVLGLTTPTITDGTFSNNGLTFTGSTLAPNNLIPPFGLFDAPGGNVYLVSSASLSLTVTPTILSGKTSVGTVAGTLTIKGTPYPGGGASVTLSGPISSSYNATLK